MGGWGDWHRKDMWWIMICKICEQDTEKKKLLIEKKKKVKFLQARPIGSLLFLCGLWRVRAEWTGGWDQYKDLVLLAGPPAMGISWVVIVSFCLACLFLLVNGNSSIPCRYHWTINHKAYIILVATSSRPLYFEHCGMSFTSYNEQNPIRALPQDLVCGQRGERISSCWIVNLSLPGATLATQAIQPPVVIPPFTLELIQFSVGAACEWMITSSRITES